LTVTATNLNLSATDNATGASPQRVYRVLVTP